MESPVTDTEYRKRLGQFFTGGRLATLLARLARAEKACSVVDPMAGTGDMLAAVRAVGGGADLLVGIEIDPGPAAVCSQRFRTAGGKQPTVLCGNAFSRMTWHASIPKSWDLVITNPPYVRYQRGKRAKFGDLTIPSAVDIRCSLIDVLRTSLHLTAEERRVMQRLAESYSGLADLAVPSWIFCASLVGVGGRLAMIVPDTWLTRDYALPVRYLLQRYFDIEVLVKDVEAAWFKDVLVRTNLLVARRVLDRGTAFQVSRGYPYVKLRASAITEESVVGSCFPDSDSPDLCFSRIVLDWNRKEHTYEGEGYSITWTPGELSLGALANVEKTDWIEACESPDRAPTKPRSSNRHAVPFGCSFRPIQGDEGVAFSLGLRLVSRSRSPNWRK